MCVVSNIGDYGKNKYWPKWPEPWEQDQLPRPGLPNVFPYPTAPTDSQRIAELERQLKELRDLIAVGKNFDRVTSQPECEDPTKLQWLDELEAMIKRMRQAGA